MNFRKLAKEVRGVIPYSSRHKQYQKDAESILFDMSNLLDDDNDAGGHIESAITESILELIEVISEAGYAAGEFDSNMRPFP